MTLFLVLFEAYPRGVSIDTCERALYADRRDGGPMSARGITAVTKRSLTRKLETKGWMVDGGRGAREYHLRRMWEPISVRRRDWRKVAPVMKAAA
jgi:hypothetical protein